MAEDILSQLANPKKNWSGDVQKKEEAPKIQQNGFVQAVLPVETVNEVPKQEIKPVEVKVETKTAEVKKIGNNQLEDPKKVEDIFKRIINSDKRR